MRDRRAARGNARDGRVDRRFQLTAERDGVLVGDVIGAVGAKAFERREQEAHVIGSYSRSAVGVERPGAHGGGRSGLV